MTIEPMHGIIPQFNLADRLRKAREVTGLGVVEFADEVGISRNSVRNYETGVTVPRPVILRAWSLRTGVPAEWLETGIAPSSGEDDGATGECSPPDSNRQPTDLRSTRRSIVARWPHTAA